MTQEISPDVPSDKKQMRLYMARPLDVHRWSDYPELIKCISDLVDQTQAIEGRARARTASGAKKYREALRCLVLDLYVAWRTNPHLLVGVALSKGHFDQGSRYSTLFLSYDHFRAALEGLAKLGYLEIVQRGFIDRKSGKGFVSRVRATPTLIDLMTDKAQLSCARISMRTDEFACESIILKDANKRPMEYDDTALTVQMRSDLATINQGIARHLIDLGVTDDEFAALQLRLSGADDGKPVDLTSTHLHRVFNNGSWDDGGRFYGGWWQNIPSTLRQYITIDGKRTVEIDYSGMHVQMLYAKVGAALNGDAYTIPGLEQHRALVKTTFMKLLNATGRIAVPHGFEERLTGTTWAAFQSRILTHHAPIKQYMRTGYGLKLQRDDADVANAVMLNFIGRRYACLPVHDSFLVHHALADELRQVMSDTFQAATGSTVKLKTALASELDTNTGKVVDDTQAISEALGLAGDYKLYQRRQYEWNAYRSRVVG